jgi:hypothetical protein
MPSTSALRTGRPPAFPDALRQACTDRLNGRLDARKISLWPQPDHAPAFRAPITAQIHPAGDIVKIAQNKTVPPQLAQFTPGTPIRSWPHIFSLLVKNFLEACADKDYHCSIFLDRFTVLVWGKGWICPLKLLHPFPIK